MAFYAILNHLAGLYANVNANPRHTKILRCMNGRAAAAERVKYYASIEIACLENALQECNRLLCRIAKIFF